MEPQTIKKTLFVALSILWINMNLTSCYKDNEENLYPRTGNCNTEAVTFSKIILPQISAQCASCHSGSGASAGIRLTNYSEISAAIDAGRFMGSIKHQAGFSAMPKGGAKMSDCSISQIEAWIANGKPNN